MADETTVESTALDGNWYDSLAGEDDGRAEMLSQYETPDAFFEAHSAAVNRDWRADIAGDDDKFKSTLERYADPVAFGNAHREAVQKIRSGDIGPKVPGEDASEEEIKAYRRDAGIPLVAEDYLKDLPDGLVIGEQDKEIVGDLVNNLHEIHTPTPIVHRLLSWYDGLQGKLQDDEAALDTQQSQEATDALRDAEDGWGKDYRTNINLVKSLLDSTFGEEASEQLRNGRFADGRGFFNDINVMKGFAALARKLNPVGLIIPNDTNAVQGMHDRLKELEGMMGNKASDYWKDPALQDEYRKLVEQRESLKKADAA